MDDAGVTGANLLHMFLHQKKFIMPGESFGYYKALEYFKENMPKISQNFEEFDKFIVRNDYFNDSFLNFIKFFFEKAGWPIKELSDLDVFRHYFFKFFPGFFFAFDKDILPIIQHEVLLPHIIPNPSIKFSAFFDLEGQLALQYVNLSKFFSFFFEALNLKDDSFNVLMKKHGHIFSNIFENLVQDLLCNIFVYDDAIIKSSFKNYAHIYDFFRKQFVNKNQNFLLQQFIFNLFRIKLYDADLFFF